MSDKDAEVARQGLEEEKGFFILPSERFCNVQTRANKDKNLNETLETVFRHIEESAKGSVSEDSFAGPFDDYDGSGSLLLKAEKVLGHEAVRNGFYGQEINVTTYNLCRINMFLHDIGFDKFDDFHVYLFFISRYEFYIHVEVEVVS